jgi:4-carboxymuconolactone decarboxylase
MPISLISPPHIIAAVRAGATKAEVAEIILQMPTYGGMPICIEGLAIAKKIFEKKPTAIKEN